MMETENSQYHLASSSSSLPPPLQDQNPDSYIGNFINLVSNYVLRYKGVLRHLNPDDLALGLQNVICYGKEKKNNNAVQIPPYVVFKKTDIKKIILTLPSSVGYSCLARECTLSNRTPHATRLPLPLISNEELNKPQATTDSDASSVNGSFSEVLQTALPQYPCSDLYDLWYGEHITHQAPPTYAASSELVFTPQSLFATFGPVPVSYPPVDGGFDCEELTKNFKQYELWGSPQENNNQEDANTIDGSSYVISRSPFGPIGRSCNPFGPIKRPSPHLPSSCDLADLGFV